MGMILVYFYFVGKWVLWNVTRIGMRGVVQSMEEIDSPPPWVLYGIEQSNVGINEIIIIFHLHSRNEIVGELAS